MKSGLFIFPIILIPLISLNVFTTAKNCYEGIGKLEGQKKIKFLNFIIKILL